MDDLVEANIQPRMLTPLFRSNSLIAYVSGTKPLCRKRPLYRQLKPRRGEPETPSTTLNTADWRYFFACRLAAAHLSAPTHR